MNKEQQMKEYQEWFKKDKEEREVKNNYNQVLKHLLSLKSKIYTDINPIVKTFLQSHKKKNSYHNYYANNKEYYLEYGQQYREKNKEKLLEYDKKQVICECGATICKRTYNKHSLTKKHIENMKK